MYDHLIGNKKNFTTNLQLLAKFYKGTKETIIT